MTIHSVGGVRTDISEMINKMRELSSKSAAFSVSKPSSASSFDSLMSVAKGAVSNVNEVMSTAENVKTEYIAGDGNVSMSQVVLASQKSKLAFEGLLTVRNKILEAYKEIMNMTV